MISEMMAHRVASEVAALKAVRPVANGRPDKFPHAIYETVDMRSKQFLNCLSAQRDGTVRFYIAGKSYAEVNAVTESVTKSLIGWKAIGTDYRIRRVDLSDESDIYQDESEPTHVLYIKSVDFAVKAMKL